VPGTYLTQDICDKCNNELATIPEWVLGTEIYKPSRIMRSIQYIWEQNVIRIWNDEVLHEEISKEPLMIE